MWILLAIVILLLVWRLRERYVDPERKVTRPSMADATWRSKVDAAAPIGEDDAKYIEVLQKFYDTKYASDNVTARPKDTDVEAFLQSTDAAAVSDKASLRNIILSSFPIQRNLEGREEKQVVTTGALAGFKGANLQPKRAVDPLARDEKDYTPADGRLGDLPEGVYAPVEQQDRPRNPGYWDSRSTSWTDAQFASVNPSAKNVV